MGGGAGLGLAADAGPGYGGAAGFLCEDGCCCAGELTICGGWRDRAADCRRGKKAIAELLSVWRYSALVRRGLCWRSQRERIRIQLRRHAERERADAGWRLRSALLAR